MARTAVVAGTATAVSNRVSRRQAERWSAEPQYQDPYAQPQAAPPPPAPPQQDRVEQLKDLAALKEQGVLTEAEFQAEKARILAG
jgi:hypothetical protein